jgi:hypothetical protein
VNVTYMGLFIFVDYHWMLMEFGRLSNFFRLCKRLLVNTVAILKVNMFLRYCLEKINENVT